MNLQEADRHCYGQLFCLSRTETSMSTLLIKKKDTDELLNVGLDAMTVENFVQSPWCATAAGNSEWVTVHVTGPKGGKTAYPVVVGQSTREGQQHTWYGTIWRRLTGKQDSREQVFNGMHNKQEVKQAVYGYLQGVYGKNVANEVPRAGRVELTPRLPLNVAANVAAANEAAQAEIALPNYVERGQYYAAVVCSHGEDERLVSVGGRTSFDNELAVKKALYNSAKKRQYNFADCVSGYILSVARSQGNNQPHAKVMKALVANCSRQLAASILVNVATNEPGRLTLREIVYNASPVDQIAIALAVGCLRVQKASTAIPGTDNVLGI